MRKVVHKLFFIWDYDREEKWLSEMAAKGLGLVAVRAFAYEFENTLPGEYRVRMQMLEHSPRHPETESYIHFLEETGVEQVGTYFKVAYFRKKMADGDFELFSDTASRIKQLTQLCTLLAVLLCANLSCALNNIVSLIRHPHPILVFGILISLSMVGVLAQGLIRLWLRRNRMKRDQQIFE